MPYLCCVQFILEQLIFLRGYLVYETLYMPPLLFSSRLVLPGIGSILVFLALLFVFIFVAFL